MDEIIKFLKSFGLGDKEIESVIKNVPVERTGLMGTNVATGVFLKGGKKEMSKLPLITEKITNPFEVNFYKGKSKEEIIKRSEDGIKYLDEELKKTADLILNKNAQLTQEQKINFAKNLETKRKFEKDLENFKTQPETPVVDIKTKEKIEDVEKLREEAGLMAPPTTPVGETQLKLKQVEQGLKDILKNKTNIDDILKDPIESQIRYAQLQRSGLVRAVAREIIEQDIKAGKLKLRPTVEKGMISPTGSGLDGDPIEVYRLYYGEDALEQLDSLAPEFNRSSTAKDAAQIAREKYPTIQPREKPIREYLTPNEIDEMTKKNPPDEFAKGGSVESKGLDYLVGLGTEDTTRKNYGLGSGLKVVTKEPAAGLMIQLDRPPQPGDPVGAYYIPPGDGSGLRSIIRAVPQPSAPSITLDAKPTVVRPEDDVVNRYRGYLNSTTPVQSDLEKRYKELINPSNPMLLTPATGLPVSIPTPVIEGTSFTSPQGEKIRFGGGAVGLIKPNGESYTGPVPENFNFFRYVAANGGAMGLDYLTGQEPPKNGYAGGGRVSFEKGTVPKMLKFLIDKLADEKDFNRKLLERANPKAVQDLYIEKYGKLPSAEELKEIVNKELQGKYSMETANPKTGEVTTPTEPVKVAKEPRTLGGLPIEERSANISDEIDKLRASGINSLENEKKLNRLSLEFVDSLDPGRRKKALDYRRKSLDTENKLIIKAEEEGLDFDTYEKLRQGLYGLGKQKTLNFIKTGKVDLETVKPPTTFEEVSSRYKDAAKAADEIFPDYNQPKTAASSLAEVMAEQKYGKVFDDISGDKQQELYEEAYNYITSINKLPKQSPAIIPEQVLEAEMNRVLNQYDKSMFIKNEQGMVDVTNPENVQKMALLLKRDHPELYKRLQEGSQIDELENFDITGRKPNATGGRVGFEKGSIPEEEDEEPSEEYIKSREAGRSKYSFDVQGPDSKIKKSGLPGRTNPKDYGLGITYLPNPGNETAPEIRVGASRRGAGIEIRKRFKDGGLGYLVGE